LLPDDAPFQDFVPETPPTATQLRQTHGPSKTDKAKGKAAVTGQKSDRYIDDSDDEDGSQVSGDDDEEDDAEGSGDDGEVADPRSHRDTLAAAYYSDATREEMDRAIEENEATRKRLTELGLPIFQPSIVLAPSGSTSVWLAELQANFKGRILRTYLPTGSSSQKAAFGADFRGTATDLERYIRAMPPNHPRTGQYIFVTSYTTATYRLLSHWLVKKDGTRLPTSKLSAEECVRWNIDPENLAQLKIDAEDARTDSEFSRHYDLRVGPGLFGTAIWDEAHRLKNPRTQSLFTLMTLKFTRVLLLTASPYPRRLKDLSSLLRVVEHTSAAEGAQHSFKHDLTVPDYIHAGELFAQHGRFYPAAPREVQLTLAEALGCASYQTLMQAHDSDVAIVRKVAPVPLSILGLRRVSGQKVMARGREYVIAGDIPPFHCTVVELEPNDIEYALYRRAHAAKIGEDETIIVPAQDHPQPINPPAAMRDLLDTESEIEGRDNIDKRRRLQGATFHSGLDNVHEYKLRANAKEVQK
ncbi:hypothetical protein KC316_g19059, partial [Hortaea werneckii]